MNMNLDKNDFTARQFRDALSHYASGLTVICGNSGDEPVGFTCQSFYSVSLNPPLVSFSVKVASSTWSLIRPTNIFSVNILSDDQHEISSKFGYSHSDRWIGVQKSLTKSGNPVIDGALLWVDCKLYNIHNAGDHDIVVGEVVEMSDFDLSSGRAPLLYFKGRYVSLRELVSGRNP